MISSYPLVVDQSGRSFAEAAQLALASKEDRPWLRLCVFVGENTRKLDDAEVLVFAGFENIRRDPPSCYYHLVIHHAV